MWKVLFPNQSNNQNLGSCATTKADCVSPQSMIWLIIVHQFPGLFTGASSLWVLRHWIVSQRSQQYISWNAELFKSVLNWTRCRSSLQMALVWNWNPTASSRFLYTSYLNFEVSKQAPLLKLPGLSRVALACLHIARIHLSSCDFWQIDGWVGCDGSRTCRALAAGDAGWLQYGSRGPMSPLLRQMHVSLTQHRHLTAYSPTWFVTVCFGFCIVFISTEDVYLFYARKLVSTFTVKLSSHFPALWADVCEAR